MSKWPRVAALRGRVDRHQFPAVVSYVGATEINRVQDTTQIPDAFDELPPPPPSPPPANVDQRGATSPREPAPQIAENTWRLPDKIDEYEILQEVGRGGMGVVFKARHAQLDRLVALKLISAGEFSPETQARFRQEADSLAHLQHPNIVQVYGVGQHRGHRYLALEYVEGGSLARRMDGAPCLRLRAPTS